jgi:hypothetical protein
VGKDAVNQAFKAIMVTREWVTAKDGVDVRVRVTLMPEVGPDAVAIALQRVPLADPPGAAR